MVSGLMMIMNAETALSSTIQASAIIDWSTFTITGYGLGSNAAPSYTLNAQSSNASSSVSDKVNWNSNTSNNSNSFSVSTDGTGAGFGSANATRSANINIAGNGFLVLSANYSIKAAISDPYYNSADASVNFVLSNSISSFTSSSQDNITLGMPWLPGNSTLTSDQKEGKLTLAFMVNNREMLNFSSAVSVNAHDFAVPVPAALWLFSSALVGLVGLGRPGKAVIG